MKTFPAVSLCISTYNWPEALELCLESVLLQTHLPDEIIIGDDGSTEETKILINQIRLKFSIPVKHIWQPDDGFKLAQIRNKSFAATTGEYIIQIDGDLVLNKFFIEDHLRFAKPGTFMSGARSLLCSEDTKVLFGRKNIKQISQEYKLEKNYNAKRVLPAAFLLHRLQKGSRQIKYVLGANMSFWKEDIVKVNGYNEDFRGWGKEDNDLSIRLSNAGVKLHFLKFAGIVYHLYHKEASKERMQENELLLMEAMRQKQTFVANGLSKYLK
jgi:glycosyltransferase involved in cell wall biosynthesis